MNYNNNNNTLQSTREMLRLHLFHRESHSGTLGIQPNRRLLLSPSVPRRVLYTGHSARVLSGHWMAERIGVFDSVWLSVLPTGARYSQELSRGGGFEIGN